MFIVSLVAVFFQTMIPTLEAVNGTPVRGNVSVGQDAGLIVTRFSPATDAMVHSILLSVILLPLTQLRLKYILGYQPGCHVTAPPASTLAYPCRADRSARFRGANPGG